MICIEHGNSQKRRMQKTTSSDYRICCCAIRRELVFSPPIAHQNPITQVSFSSPAKAAVSAFKGPGYAPGLVSSFPFCTEASPRKDPVRPHRRNPHAHAPLAKTTWTRPLAYTVSVYDRKGLRKFLRGCILMLKLYILAES